MGNETSIDLGVTLTASGSSYECTVMDVAPRGIFLLSEVALRKHQLVRLELDLPSGERIFVFGMVEWVLEPDEEELGIEPGFAVRFYGMGRSALEKWEEVENRWAKERDVLARPEDEVSEQRAATPNKTGAEDLNADPSLMVRPLSPEQEEKLLSTVRRHERRPSNSFPEVGAAHDEKQADVSSKPFPVLEPTSCEEDVAHGRPGWFDPGSDRSPLAREGLTVFRLRLRSEETLHKLAETAFRRGTISLRTSKDRPVGSPAIVRFMHPMFEREFHVPGTIGPALQQASGIVVSFLGVTEKTRSCFQSFIHAPDAMDEVRSGSASEDESLNTYLGLIERGVWSEEIARYDENTEEVALVDILSAIDVTYDEQTT